MIEFVAMVDNYNLSFKLVKPLVRNSLFTTDLGALLCSTGCRESSGADRSRSTLNPTTQEWPDYAVIDVHAHIGTYRGYDLSIETLLDNLNRYRIRLALISNIDGAELPGITGNLDEGAANKATVEIIRCYPDKLKGLAWVRPGTTDGSAASIEPFLRDEGFVGVKLHPEMNHFAADDPEVDPYLDLCARHKVPAVFHCGADGSNSAPDRIYRIARRHPTVPVVLYHMGFETDHRSAIRTVKESISKRDALLYLDTAQVSAEDALRAIEAVGSERVLFGTDATYYGKDHYRNYRPLVALLKMKLSRSDFDKVMWSNAERLFNLSAR